jgi:L-asparagine transporter-like permease
MKIFLIIAFIALSLVLVGSFDYQSTRDEGINNETAANGWFHQPKYKGVF